MLDVMPGVIMSFPIQCPTSYQMCFLLSDFLFDVNFDVMSYAVFDIISDSMSDVIFDVIFDVMSDVISDAMSDIMSTVTSAVLISCFMLILSQDPHERKLRNDPRYVNLPIDLKELICQDKIFNSFTFINFELRIISKLNISQRFDILVE